MKLCYIDPMNQCVNVCSCVSISEREERKVCILVHPYDGECLRCSCSEGQSHCCTPPENREGSGVGVGTVQVG